MILGLSTKWAQILNKWGNGKYQTQPSGNLKICVTHGLVGLSVACLDGPHSDKFMLIPIHKGEPTIQRYLPFQRLLSVLKILLERRLSRFLKLNFPFQNGIKILTFKFLQKINFSLTSTFKFNSFMFTIPVAKLYFLQTSRIVFFLRSCIFSNFSHCLVFIRIWKTWYLAKGSNMLCFMKTERTSNKFTYLWVMSVIFTFLSCKTIAHEFPSSIENYWINSLNKFAVDLSNKCNLPSTLLP